MSTGKDYLFGKRGFASMDPARVKEIASMGGKAAHKLGTAHEWTSEEAREAGRRGGRASKVRRLLFPKQRPLHFGGEADGA